MTFITTKATVAPLIDTLRLLRKAKGMPARVVDERAGVADGLTEKFESNARKPSIEALKIWCDALGARLVVIPALPMHQLEAWRGRRLPTTKRA